MSFSSHTSEVTPEVVRAMRAAIKVTGVAKLFAANITADGPAETPRQVRPGPARPALRGLRLPRKGYGAAQQLPAFFKPRPLQRHHDRSRRRLRPQGPEPGATSCRQGEEAWTPWGAGVYGSVSLSDGVIEYAKTREEIKGAFPTV